MDAKEQFSPEESLRLIQVMIDRTRRTISVNSRYFLLWGWATFAIMVMQYILDVVYHSPYAGHVWLIMFPLLFITGWWLARDRAGRKAKSYAGSAMWEVWTAIALAYVSGAAIFYKLHWENIFPVFMVLHSIGIFLSGRILQFKPFVWGSLISFVLAAVAIWLPYDQQNLMAALAILINYIIPGHIFRKQYNEGRYATE